MPAFVYRAVDAAGRPQRGVVEAANESGARRSLRDRALLPTRIEATTGGASAAALQGTPRFSRRRLSARALARATRQIATLIGSDVRIEEALRLVAAQSEQGSMRPLLLNLRGTILDGRSFAGAIAEQRGVFPEYYRAAIAAGEQSSRLADVLSHLAEFVENRHRTQQRVRLALLYPALLAVVSVSMMILLMIYVVPDIVRVFVSRGADLPFLTRALIALSSGITSFGLIGAGVLALGGIAVQRWLRIPANRLRFDRYLATNRPFASFSRQLNAARFASSLATLVQSAVPLVDALFGAAAVTPNRHIRAEVTEVAARVREGSTLHRAMDESGVFPPMLVAIVASGETGGRLAPALARAASELERELDALIATLVALVEPAVLLLMGGLVLLMVLAILLPIINLNNLVAI